MREPLGQTPLIAVQWLRSLPAPVTVVRGAEDRLCGAEWARGLAAAAPQGRLVELAGAAHMTVQTHPAQIAAVLEEELHRIAAGVDRGEAGA